ncbi:SLATT domain-containing protein [Hydrogenovibrio sp. JE_KL2]|uniref:SLATT domain-containing protein n=1 Tax=Hydrogenovibrio sp. JE_KL2 TaxID=2651188 RepID=UPI00128BCE6D|nr:SLATT domain-containing protein [Hydrogenovibrio sp. JE_KL2]MPQ75696.1 SLATT domain-containing protein [Hydrogenovibrio sp. JE_KL2]
MNKQKIINKIWWTKKARIYSEIRLKANAKLSQHILIWYSFIAVCTSIYGLKYQLDTNVELALIFLSIGILVLSIIVNYSRFNERAMEMKKSYEMLNKLHDEADYFDQRTINNEYLGILELSENHTDLDYVSALVNEYENLAEHKKDPQSENYPLSSTPSQAQIDKYHSYKCLNMLLIIFYWALPALTLIPIHFLLK